MNANPRMIIDAIRAYRASRVLIPMYLDAIPEFALGASNPLGPERCKRVGKPCGRSKSDGVIAPKFIESDRFNLQNGRQVARLYGTTEPLHLVCLSICFCLPDYRDGDSSG